MKRICERILSIVCLLLSILWLAGCISKQTPPTKIPFGLSIEEYPLQAAPALDPLSFVPEQGTQEEILAKRQQERNVAFPDNAILFKGQPALSIQLGQENLAALEFSTKSITTQGAFQKVTVQVWQDEQEIFSVPAGDVSPVDNLRGLWGYSDHWVLEIAKVDLAASSNETPLEPIGQIFQDGESLNGRHGYDQAFGFQLIRSKPFFFLEQHGEIGISYDGQQASLGYTQIPHYLCCSDSELNPRIAQNIVAFFAQRQGKWYYVELGAFE